jgi:hypothetical protein
VHRERIAREVAAPYASPTVAHLLAQLVERAASDAERDGGEHREDDAENGHTPQRSDRPRVAD